MMSGFGLAAFSLLFICYALSCTGTASSNVLPDATPRKMEWYEEKHSWSMRHLTRTSALNLSDLVNVARIGNNILPYILYPRAPGSSGSANARHIITVIMQDMLGWTVEYDTFIDAPPLPFRRTHFTNIIATHDPNARRRLILACHYDTKVSPKGFVGAVDSAVPCSMIMELAVALRDYLTKGKTDLTLQFIFFDGEEAFERWTETDSLYGSRHLAKLWENTPWPMNASSTDKNKLDSIDLLAVLDLLGAAYPRFYNMYLVNSKNFEDLIRIEKLLYGSNSYFRKQIRRNYIQDDHIPFYERNVSVLHVIADPFPRQWHTLQDNASNLDWTSIQRITRIFAVFIAEYLHLNISP